MAALAESVAQQREDRWSQASHVGGGHEGARAGDVGEARSKADQRAFVGDRIADDADPSRLRRQRQRGMIRRDDHNDLVANGREGAQRMMEERLAVEERDALVCAEAPRGPAREQDP